MNTTLRRCLANNFAEPLCSASRCIELDPDLQKKKAQLAPDNSIDSSRFLRVAVLGCPNVGKSVLTNAIVGCNVSAVSRKMNTTQRMTTAVVVDDCIQLALVDTPGIVTGKIGKRHSMKETLVQDPERSLRSAEYVLVVSDASDKYKSHRLSPKVQHLLCRHRHLPSALVLNKVDLVKKKFDALEMMHALTKGIVNGQEISRAVAGGQMTKSCRQERIRQIVDAYHVEKKEDKPHLNLNVDAVSLEQLIACAAHQVDQGKLHKCFAKEHGWPHFEAVFMTSALHGNGVAEVRRFLLDKSHQASWQYHSSVITDEDCVHIVCNIIRAKMLDHLPQEIPYRLRLNIIVWERDALGTLCIRAVVSAEHERWVRIILGKAGSRIREIVRDATQDMRNLFQHEVYLRLDVQS